VLADRSRLDAIYDDGRMQRVGAPVSAHPTSRKSQSCGRPEQEESVGQKLVLVRLVHVSGGAVPGGIDQGAGPQSIDDRRADPRIGRRPAWCGGYRAPTAGRTTSVVVRPSRLDLRHTTFAIGATGSPRLDRARRKVLDRRKNRTRSGRSCRPGQCRPLASSSRRCSGSLPRSGCVARRFGHGHGRRRTRRTPREPKSAGRRSRSGPRSTGSSAEGSSIATAMR